jgi:hypothetical protein
LFCGVAGLGQSDCLSVWKLSPLVGFSGGPAHARWGAAGDFGVLCALLMVKVVALFGKFVGGRLGGSQSDVLVVITMTDRWVMIATRGMLVLEAIVGSVGWGILRFPPNGGQVFKQLSLCLSGIARSTQG